MVKKQIIPGILTALFIIFLFWAGGYDFDTRRHTAVFCSILTVVCGGGVMWMQLIVDEL